MMNDKLNLTYVIYSLLIASLSFALVGVSIRMRVQGRKKLFAKIFEDLDLFTQTMSSEIVRSRKKVDFSKLIPQKYKSSLREKLSKSGKVGNNFLVGLIRSKYIYASAFAVLGIIYFLPSGRYFQILLALSFGFFLPDILLTNTIQKRAETIVQALPDSVEMLTMCVEAGLSFQQALKRVSENQDTVISNEFARVMSEIQIGEPRSIALSNMGERLNHPDVSKFVSAMMQVDRLGIPISAVLREQVQELRSRSRMRAREQAQKVPIKILGPVMACFMPCTLIIVLGPVILQFVS